MILRFSLTCEQMEGLDHITQHESVIVTEVLPDLEHPINLKLKDKIIEAVERMLTAEAQRP